MPTKLPDFHLRSYLLIQHVQFGKICGRKGNVRCLVFAIIVTAKRSTLFVPVMGLNSNRVLACPPGLSCGKLFWQFDPQCGTTCGQSCVFFLLLKRDFQVCHKSRACEHIFLPKYLLVVSLAHKGGKLISTLGHPLEMLLCSWWDKAVTARTEC